MAKCGGINHADCPAHEHEEWCFDDDSQCGDKDCDCHRRWAETAPEPPW